MAELPTGTVTFLFTDIEGSTALLHELGDRSLSVLDAHGAILRRAIAEGGGIEVSTAGDSFFASFPSAAGALAAAVAAQRGLFAHPWPPGHDVRVRIGMHTGEAVVRGDNYVGMDVNRAARISAAAHGGQIVLSDATRALVEHSLPDGVTLRALGSHRLKDIVHPEALHDVVIEALPADFPPLRTLDARPNNLPVELTSFVGRDEELARVTELLSRGRLLTLTGAGGTGKTRLALRLASELLSAFRDGVFFVDLSAVRDPALVPAEIAKELGVAENPGRSIVEGLEDHLRTKELLLVVDNFEQVTEAGAVLERLVTAAPELKVVVTSRSVLSLRGEQEYSVPPLDPPTAEDLSDVARLESVESVRLFTERATAVQPAFELTEDNARAVGEIIVRLDGLPLAIELAATRTKVLPPEEMLPRLEERLAILTSGVRTVPQRQRTLRDAIAWSHDLLDADEQALFARLSVFSGGWSLDAAEKVCADEGESLPVLENLASLVDKSLVRPAAPGRFTMLETIRAFATERLRARPDHDDIRRRHADLYLGLAIAAEPHLTREDQREWLDRCDLEHDNIRTALRWAIDAGDAERAQSAAGALWRFWQQRGHLDEGRRWIDEVLAMPEGQAPSAARAKALIGAGGLAWWQKDGATAAASYEEALEIERERGDPEALAEALYNHSFVVAGRDVHAAAGLLEESLALFREAGNESGVAQASGMLVIPDAEAGRWEAVVARLEETTGIWRRLGERLHLAFDLVWLAFAYGRAGRPPEAWSTGLEALELFCRVDNPTGIGIVLIDLAWLSTWEGRHEHAIRLAGASEAIRERTGGPPGGFAGLLEGDPAALARAHVPADVAERAWTEGLDMSVDDAAAYARRARS
jgi:predicted ATPase/class 3 adenylate cyclase